MVEAKSKWISPTESQCKGGEMDERVCSTNWKNAKKICSALGGRLPSRDELMAEVIKCGGEWKNWEKNKKNTSYQACCKNNGFFSSSFYWSSTTYASGTSNAWIVYSGNGYDGNYDESYSHFVRCVRAGQ